MLELAVEAGLFLHLADRTGLVGLTGQCLPFRERPVVVLRPVDNDELQAARPVTDDDSPAARITSLLT